MKMFILACMLLGVTVGYSQERKKPVATAAKIKSVPVTQRTGYQVTGIVHVNNLNACGTWISFEQGKKVVRLFPENLPAVFKKDGKVIRFDYGVVKNNNGVVCQGGNTVLLENVSLVK